MGTSFGVFSNTTAHYVSENTSWGRQCPSSRRMGPRCDSSRIVVFFGRSRTKKSKHYFNHHLTLLLDQPSLRRLLCVNGLLIWPRQLPMLKKLVPGIDKSCVVWCLCRPCLSISTGWSRPLVFRTAPSILESSYSLAGCPTKPLSRRLVRGTKFQNITSLGCFLQGTWYDGRQPWWDH